VKTPAEHEFGYRLQNVVFFLLTVGMEDNWRCVGSFKGNASVSEGLHFGSAAAFEAPYARFPSQSKPKVHL